MSDTKEQADLIRRDLGHADRRREHATSLRRMLDWIRMSRETDTLAVAVPAHQSILSGMWHKERRLTLDSDQVSAFTEFLSAEATRLDRNADGIEAYLLRKSADPEVAA